MGSDVLESKLFIFRKENSLLPGLKVMFLNQTGHNCMESSINVFHLCEDKVFEGQKL